MASLPYVTAPGNIPKALVAIRKAATPEKVTGDFVKTVLKIPGGSGDQILSFLKKTGFANTDGTPTELYTKFRNPTSSGSAAAEAMRKAYAPLYKRNEFTHQLDESDLVGLIVEETGKAHDSSTVGLITSSIQGLKKFADFKTIIPAVFSGAESDGSTKQSDSHSNDSAAKGQSFGLNLGYTINLNLPATTDIAVFNAIFKSLKENLMKSDDA